MPATGSETPNTQLAIFNYGDLQIVFEVRGFTGGESSIALDGGNYIGNLFLGGKGVMALDARSFRIYLGDKREAAEEMKLVEPEPDTPSPHIANFLGAMRSRKAESLAAEVEVGYISSSLCYLANISYRVGRELIFDPAAERFPGDAAANALLTRKYRKPYVVPERV